MKWQLIIATIFVCVQSILSPWFEMTSCLTVNSHTSGFILDSHDSDLLKWFPVIPASWYPCPFVMPYVGEWVGPSDLLSNRILQKWCDVTSRLGYKRMWLSPTDALCSVSLANFGERSCYVANCLMEWLYVSRNGGWLGSGQSSGRNYGSQSESPPGTVSDQQTPSELGSEYWLRWTLRCLWPQPAPWLWPCQRPWTRGSSWATSGLTHRPWDDNQCCFKPGTACHCCQSSAWRAVLESGFIPVLFQTWQHRWDLPLT